MATIPIYDGIRAILNIMGDNFPRATKRIESIHSGLKYKSPGVINQEWYKVISVLEDDLPTESKEGEIIGKMLKGEVDYKDYLQEDSDDSGSYESPC